MSDLDRAGPKYLNTGETPLYHKGAQLYGVLQDQLSSGAIPVLVEGPMDAIAATLASQGSYLGVAPLGTSRTEEQAAQLARISVHPVVATDADPAGRSAAERDYWLLSCHRLDPRYAPLPESTDPADLLALKGPTALTGALAAARPLAERLLEERLTNLPPAQALLEAARVVAARPARQGPGQQDHQLAARCADGVGPPHRAHTRQRVEHRPAPSRATTPTNHRRGQTPNINRRREPG